MPLGQTDLIGYVYHYYAEGKTGRIKLVDQAASPEILTGFLKRRLPGYKVPKKADLKKKQDFYNDFVSWYSKFMEDMKIVWDKVKKNSPDLKNYNKLDRIDKAFYSPYEPDAQKKCEALLTESQSQKDRRYFDQFKIINELMKKGYFDPDQSDRKLTELFMNYRSIIDFGFLELKDLDSLISRMEKDQGNTGLTNREKKEIPEIRKSFEAFTQISTILRQRLNMMLNPIYPYMQSTIINPGESRKIMDPSGDVDDDILETDPNGNIRAIEEIAILRADLSFIKDSKVKSLLPSLYNKLGNKPQIYSDNMAFVNDASEALTGLNNVLYARKEDGTGKWLRYELMDDWSFKVSPVSAQRQEEISAFYEIKSSDEAKDIVKDIENIDFKNGIDAYNGRGEKIHLHYQEDIWACLSTDKAFSYRDEKKNLHCVKMDLTGLSDVQLSAQAENLLSKFSETGVKAIYTEDCRRVDFDCSNVMALAAFLAENQGFYYKKNDGMMQRFHLEKDGTLFQEDRDIREFYEMRLGVARGLLEEADVQYENLDYTLNRIQSEWSEPGFLVSDITSMASTWANNLKKATRLGKSSKQFDHVREALEDLAANAAHMSPDQLTVMMESIAAMADIYMAGKDIAKLSGNNYRINRYDVMNSVKNSFGGYASDLQKIGQTRCPIRTDGSAVNAKTREMLKKNIRRSMRGREFNKERFAQWKALTSFDGQGEVSQTDITAGYMEIRNSDAIRFIEREIYLTPENENQANLYYETARAGLEAVGNLKAMDDTAFLAFYREVAQKTNKSFISGYDMFDEALNRKMLSKLNSEAKYRGMDLRSDGRIRNTGKDPRYNYHTRQIILAFLAEMKPAGGLTDLREKLAKHTLSLNETNSLSSYMQILCNEKYLTRAVEDLNPLTQEQKDRISGAANTMTGFADSMYSNVLLKHFSLQEIALLISDPELADKIKLNFNPDLILNGENQGALDEAARLQGENLCTISFTNNDGESKDFSLDFLTNGSPDEKEKEFLDTFISEIHDYADERSISEAGRISMGHDSQMVDNIPEEMPAYLKTGSFYEEETGELADTIDSFNQKLQKGALAGKDYADYIIIGGVSGSDILKAEAKRYKLEYAGLSDHAKKWILAGLSLAAIKNGKAVTFVSDNLSVRSASDIKPEIESFVFTNAFGSETPEGREQMQKLWEEVKGNFPAEKRPEKMAALQREAVAKAAVSVRQATDKKYIAQSRLSKIFQINAEKADIITNREKSYTDKICELAKNAYGGGAGDVKAYSFKNGLKLPAAAAIMAIAYAGASENMPLPPGEKPYFDGNFKLHVGMFIQEAAKVYKEIQEESLKNPSKADQEMRRYIVRGLTNMSVIPSLKSNVLFDQEKMNLEDYALRFAGELKIKKMLITFAGKDKTPAGYGNTSAEKKRTLVQVFEKEGITTDRDAAATSYIELAEDMDKVYKGRNIPDNMTNARKKLGAYIQIKSELGKTPQPLTPQKTIDLINKAEKFAGDMILAQEMPAYSAGKPYLALLENDLGKMQTALLNPQAAIQKTKQYQAEKTAEKQVGKQAGKQAGK